MRRTNLYAILHVPPRALLLAHLLWASSDLLPGPSRSPALYVSPHWGPHRFLWIYSDNS